MMADKETEMKFIQDYINQRPKDNGDLLTLLNTIGRDEFLMAVQEADGRRIIIYTLPEDEDKDDPPIYWRYGRRKNRSTAQPSSSS